MTLNAPKMACTAFSSPTLYNMTLGNENALQGILGSLY